MQHHRLSDVKSCIGAYAWCGWVATLQCHKLACIGAYSVGVTLAFLNIIPSLDFSGSYPDICALGMAEHIQDQFETISRLTINLDKAVRFNCR